MTEVMIIHSFYFDFIFASQLHHRHFT